MKVLLSWYPVKDLEQAKKFYGDVLGLHKIFEMQGWAEFSHAEGQAAIALSQSPNGTGEGGATVVLAVENLDATRRNLSKRGVNFEGDVMEIPGVVRIATFRDPFGNRLQLAQNLMAG